MTNALFAKKLIECVVLELGAIVTSNCQYRDIVLTLHLNGEVDEGLLTFVPVDFLIMDMENKTSSPIILVRPFLRTTGATIDSKEGNVKFQFHTRNSWNTSQG